MFLQTGKVSDLLVIVWSLKWDRFCGSEGVQELKGPKRAITIEMFLAAVDLNYFVLKDETEVNYWLHLSLLAKYRKVPVCMNQK